MNKILIFVLIGVFLFACNKDKEDDGWSYCTDCNLDDWTGSYSGTCNLYDALNNFTFQELQIEYLITSGGNGIITVALDVPTHFNMTVSGSLQSAYFISFSGTEKSFLGTMYKKENRFRLTGSAKTFRYKAGELELLKSVNFETVKNQ